MHANVDVVVHVLVDVDGFFNGKRSTISYGKAWEFERLSAESLFPDLQCL